MRRGEQDVTFTVPDLYSDAWNNPLAHNSLRPADLIVRVEVPTAKNRSSYMQVSEKGDFDWALVRCAAAGRKTGSLWTQVAVFLGAVAPIPYELDSTLLERDGLTSDSIVSIAESPRLEGYTADAQRVRGANRSSFSPPLSHSNHNLNHAFRTV